MTNHDKATFGGMVRAERASRMMTIEKACSKASVTTKTWMRLEQGRKVQDWTVSAVDRAFDFPAGTAFAVYTGTSEWPVSAAIGWCVGSVKPRSEESALRDRVSVAIHDSVCDCLNKGFGYTLRSRDLDAMSGAVMTALATWGGLGGAS